MPSAARHPNGVRLVVGCSVVLWFLTTVSSCVRIGIFSICAAGIAGSVTVYSSGRWFIPFVCIPVPLLSPVLEDVPALERRIVSDSLFSSRWAKNRAACRCATADGFTRRRDGDATAVVGGSPARVIALVGLGGAGTPIWSRWPDRRRRHHAWYSHHERLFVILRWSRRGCGKLR